MKRINLKAVGDKIKAFIKLKYEYYINRIAINSKVYKDLYNEYNDLIITNKYLPEVAHNLKLTQVHKLINKMFDLPGVFSKLGTFDIDIIRNTGPNDILIVADSLEKYKVLEEMKNFSGSGQVFTLEDLQDPMTQIKFPIERIYVFSSIWLNDLIRFENLLYKFENYKEANRL